MIESEVVDEIRRLLEDEGLTQTRIANRLGVSRGTVSAIARGIRPDRSAWREQEARAVASVGPLDRCPTCGRFVQQPCLACQIAATTKRKT